MIAAMTWRFLVEYARRPLNIVLLVGVPGVFVLLSAGAIGDFQTLLAGSSESGRPELATAGWAAAFLAGVAGLFHVSASRGPDVRLARVGRTAKRVVAARLASGLLLAAVATIASLSALAVRTPIPSPGRIAAATALLAVTYLGLGAGIGALVRSELDGSLILLLVWMTDVFIGPVIGGGESTVTTWFPSHFPTVVATGAVTAPADVMLDLGASAVWAVASLVAAVIALSATARPRATRSGPARTARARFGACLRSAWREYRRNRVLWVLLVGVPAFFISVSIAVTPPTPTPVELTEAGNRGLALVPLTQVHGAIMVPIAVAFLSSLAGLFVVLGSAEADRRLVIAGFKPREVLTARLGVVAAAALLVSVASLLVTATGFTPRSWIVFTLATLIIAVTYAMIGVTIGPLVGPVGGLFLLFLLPFLDVGLGQNIMFDAAPPTWAAWLPGHGAVRVLVDGAFTNTFDEYRGLALAIAWLAGATAAAVTVFHQLATPRGAGRLRTARSARISA